MGTRTIQAVEITPEEAKDWLEAFAYPYQRPIRREQVKRLSNAIIAGDFISGTSLWLARCGEATYLIDGQHRLTAVIETGIAQEFDVKETECDTLDDVAKLYGHIDTGAVRTPGDYYKALQLTERTGLNRTQLNALSYAVPILLSGGVAESVAPSIEIRERIISLYAPYMINFYANIAVKVPREVDSALRRSYVQAFIALTMRWPSESKDNTTAEFWRGCIFDDGLTANDPRKLINRQFVSYRIAASTANRGGSMSRLQGFRAMSFAYNAYVSGRTLAFTRINAGGDKIKITGVPSDFAKWTARD